MEWKIVGKGDSGGQGVVQKVSSDNGSLGALKKLHGENEKNTNIRFRFHNEAEAFEVV